MIRMEHRHEGDVLVVSLNGELDGRSAPGLQTELENLVPTGGHLLFDLRHMTYLSSGGLRLLYLLYRRAEAEETQVVLSGLDSDVRGVMAATGFLGFFTVTETVEAGLQALREAVL